MRSSFCRRLILGAAALALGTLTGSAEAAPSDQGVLLIPDWTADVVAMFDPYDGTYLGDLITNSTGLLDNPICAIEGPDNNIYVSDQTKDAVYVFDWTGKYLHTYADSSDGLDNIRGIEFHSNGNLYIATHTEVAVFSGPHTRLPDYTSSSAQESFFDVLLRPDGSSLLSLTVGAAPGIHHYSAAGVSLGNIVPAFLLSGQVQRDTQLPGDYLAAFMADGVVKGFDISGTVSLTTQQDPQTKGVIRLGNGNLLVCSQQGVVEFDGTTGFWINLIRTGSGWQYIEKAGNWFNLGKALPGSLGNPLLGASGELSAGSIVSLSLSKAAPNTTAFVIVGVQNISLPFFGGTIVPSPNIIFALPTGPSGAVTLPASYPTGPPAGFPVYLQCWILDPTGPQGFTASNAVTSTTE